MKKKLDKEESSLFMGNYFCLIEKHKMAFVAISKNGVTSLKSIAIQDREGLRILDEDTIHYKVGYSPENGYLVPVGQMREWEQQNVPVLKFAVWRDPVERLVSTYKYFCLERENRSYLNYLDLYCDSSFERFMEFVEFELKKSRPLFQDEHIRRQVDYFRRQDVDVVVHMERLNEFLRENGVIWQEEKINSTSVQFRLTDESMIKRIKELYQADYEIIVDY